MPLSQALDERRLSLKLDQKGIITHVGGSSKGLFGFDPQVMVGKSISNFVDVFQRDEGEPIQDTVLKSTHPSTHTIYFPLQCPVLLIS